MEFSSCLWNPFNLRYSKLALPIGLFPSFDLFILVGAVYCQPSFHTLLSVMFRNGFLYCVVTAVSYEQVFFKSQTLFSHPKFCWYLQTSVKIEIEIDMLTNLFSVSKRCWKKSAWWILAFTSKHFLYQCFVNTTDKSLCYVCCQKQVGKSGKIAFYLRAQLRPDCSLLNMWCTLVFFATTIQKFVFTLGSQ